VNTHRRLVKVFSLLSLIALVYACSTPHATDIPDQDKAIVEIDKEVHFLDSSGEDVVVSPGAYEIQAEKEGLRFIAEEGTGSESVVIDAQSTTHKEPVTSPTAVGITDEEDEQIVMLLLPGGTGWEARGSQSGVVSRAVPRRPIPQSRVNRIINARAKILKQLPQLKLSGVSVRYAKMNKTYRGSKSRNTWRLPVSDTLATSRFTFVWSGASKPPSQISQIKQIVSKKTCCLRLIINRKAMSWPTSSRTGRTPLRKPSLTVAFDRKGNLVTTVLLQNARAKNWPKTLRLEISSGKNTWNSGDTKIYATAQSYYASVLHPIFSHARCTTCHTLGTRQAIVAMHQDRLGASSYPDNPEAKPHNPNFCGGCHSIPQRSGHTDLNLNNEWFSPDQVQGINWKGWNAGRVCAKVTGPFTNKDGVTGPPFNAQNFHHHFHDDPRILWAVSSGWVPFSRPDLPVPMKNNLPGWFGKVDPWVDAGTPCPKWRFFGRPSRSKFQRR